MYLSEIVALCGDKTKEDGACNIPYPNDRIIYRSGWSRNSGDGTCSGPATCTGCKLGFYPQNGGTDGYCRSNNFLFKNVQNKYMKAWASSKNNWLEETHQNPNLSKH